jgi:CheY-like chemotaxis protein
VPAETDLNSAVRAALEVTAYGARSSGINIDTDFAPGPMPVLADADHITQVAANFLINSQHALAAHNGERRITVRTFRLGDRRVGFCVEDTGPGIPVAIRHRIFDSYFTTKPVGVGTGIGLSISKAIVERHKGSIRFEEVTPNGARFVVELAAFAGARTGTAAQEIRSTELRHALIIDDEPDVAASLSDILELMGIKSRVVTAWGSAQAVLADYSPDIIFSDLRMPDASGITIYRELIAYNPELGRRFVLVTGDMVGARAEIGALSAHERPLVLEKPFSTLDVRSALAAVNDQTTLTH